MQDTNLIKEFSLYKSDKIPDFKIIDDLYAKQEF
jgi:hypothetical protein